MPAETTPLLPLEDRFKLLVDSVQDYAIFMLDTSGRVVTWNEGAQRIKGWSAGEIIGRPFSTFYPQALVDSGFPQEELRRASIDGRFENEGWRVRKDGSRFWANVVITALRDERGVLQGFAKVTRDLSERRWHEEALRQSEERLRLLVEAVKDHAIFMLDTEGYVETWNGGATAITGYAASAVLGHHVSMFYPRGDLQAGRPAQDLERAIDSGRAESEGWRLRQDGALFWAHTAITAVYDAQGELRGFAHVMRDMSEQRRVADLERSSRRMTEFLAMLAHELRNPLAPIRNAVSIMRLQPDLAPALQQCRDIIDRQLRDMTRLVDDLLDVGRIASGKIVLQPRRIDYRDVMQRSVEAARPLMQERGHRFDVQMPAQRIDVMGDDTRLVQALQNLLTNAARYTEPGGSITLDVQPQRDTLVVAVVDSGRGIEPDAIERIFELFVQEDPERSPSGGLGVGLRLARTLVELHGGTLTAASPGRGKGATFTMRLPLPREDS